MGESTHRKSGPIWAMDRNLPLTSSRIFTWAEWPPLLDKAIMDEILIQNARAYAFQHQLQIAERLGFGIHGIVFVAKNNFDAGKTAIKAHRAEAPYFRERAVYERLQIAEIWEILCFRVPKLLNFDDGLRVIELSIVSRPFVLDFAGAWLDVPPDFSEEIWADWEAEKIAQFESRWSIVQSVIRALEELYSHGGCFPKQYSVS